MTKRTTGEYENVIAGGEDVPAFLPYSLPPRDPVFNMSEALGRRLRAAEQALVRLDLATEMVPSLDWFLYGFVRKEAVISLQIEGTQATLLDLLSFEADDVNAPDADVEEVCNYLDALNNVQQELANPTGIPISMRLLNGAHRRLMDGVRGATKQPGEIRRSQNWIGGSRPGNAVFVPPPPTRLPTWRTRRTSAAAARGAARPPRSMLCRHPALHSQNQQWPQQVARETQPRGRSGMHRSRHLSARSQ